MVFFKLGLRRKKQESQILFVNRFYWPDQSATSQLLTDLAEHMVKQGVRVTIITSRLHYASSEKLAPNEDHNGVAIHRVWTTAFNRSSLLGRMLDFVTFCIFATVALIRKTRSNDIVVAKTDPPLIQLFAWFAASLKRAKVVNWCQDLFPEAAFALMSHNKRGSLGALLHGLRNRVLKSSDLTVTVSAEMRQTLISQGIRRDRVIVIRNWCDQRIMPIQKDQNALRRRWQLEEDFVIGYSGNLGRAHVPDKIHLLIEKLADIPRLRFLFIGSGHGMAWLKDKCRDEGHDHVMFQNYQPIENLSTSLSVPDLHLISLASGGQKFVAPSKFYGILAAGRPVAFIGDRQSELAREIRLTRCGVTLPIDHVDHWRRSILDLIASDEERSSMGAKARQVYEWRFQASVSLDAWQRVIAPTTSVRATPDLQESISITQ